jgi:four helix bundle protein
MTTQVEETGSGYKAGKNYRDLLVWQKAIDLTLKTYSLTKAFPKEEMYGLTQQMRRAAVSVPANIAEGQGRDGKKEFYHFLGIASGSLSELQTHMILAEKLGFSTAPEIQAMLISSEEVAMLLNGLRRSLETAF